jgi:hypothetical protein
LFEPKLEKYTVEKIIKFNPQLEPFEVNVLLDYGIFSRRHIESVLQNTPDLTDDEKQLVKSMNHNIDLRGSSPFKTDPKLIQALSERFENAASEQNEE